MAALRDEEWLHLAKRNAIGGSSRHSHPGDRTSRPNLIVSNTADRWFGYCASCKRGGVKMKEHVRVTGIAAPRGSEDLTLPPDMQRVLLSDKAVQDGVHGFLASKHMDAAYMPDLWYSKARCRILIEHDQQWLGRDTTERSPQKWITYNQSNHLAPLHPAMNPIKRAIVVEDAFSFYKVDWALRQGPEYVFCSLGTKLSNQLIIKLLQYDDVIMFYDGDKAGYVGADRESHRLRSMGVSSKAHCAPAGMDPKDMAVLAIQLHVGGSIET